MTKKKVVYASMVLAFAALVVIGGYFLYLKATYLDRAVDTGEAYGLSIGDTKQEVFANLRPAFREIGASEDEIFIEIRTDEVSAKGLQVSPGRHVMVRPKIDVFGADNFSADEQWTFYIGPAHRNFLRLKFCGETLCRIYRHRKYFDLP